MERRLMTTTEQLCSAAGISWQSADNVHSLADKLAETVAQRLQKRVDANGVASLVVSGGSTPAPVFERLSGIDLAWEKIQITLADERWVAPTEKDSNERLLRQTLLVDKASAASLVPLFQPDIKPELAVDSVGKAVAAMAQPFTVVILGMGNDGHTASLFPDAAEDELRSAMDPDNKAIVSILNPPSVAQARISLTRAALLNSDNRFLHITGEQKRQVLGDALLASSPGQSSEPVPGGYTHGMKPIVGLLTENPVAASVFWSP